MFKIREFSYNVATFWGGTLWFENSSTTCMHMDVSAQTSWSLTYAGAPVLSQVFTCTRHGKLSSCSQHQLLWITALKSSGLKPKNPPQTQCVVVLQRTEQIMNFWVDFQIQVVSLLRVPRKALASLGSLVSS